MAQQSKVSIIISPIKSSMPLIPVWKGLAVPKLTGKMGKLKAAIVPKASSHVNAVKSEAPEASALIMQIKAAK